MRSTVICVDDDKFLLRTLADQLEEWIGKNYAVEKATSGDEALEIFEDCRVSGQPVSVVISDYIMPIMRGDELLCKIHALDKSVRKIMLTGYSQLEGIITAINKGGLYRFISKPWDKKDLMLTIIGALKSYEQEKVNENLLQGFDKLYRGYETKLDHIITSLARAIDIRSGNKPGHSQNVAEISQKIGEKAGLDADTVKSLRMMAAFHDIGRLILFDVDLMPIRGNEQALYDSRYLITLQNEAAKKIFSLTPQLDEGLLIGICYHLEKFDGTGINSMKGKDIPIEARIIAIANYYDFFTSGGNSRQAAFKQLYDLKDTFFDPELLALFRSVDWD